MSDNKQKKYRNPDKEKIRRKKDIEKLKDFIWNYLLDHPCIDCGNNDPVVLHFDHRNPDDKKYAISDAIYRLRSVESLKREIEKCDVRCANCHMKRSAKQFGWHQKYLAE